MTVLPVTNYKRMINGYDLNITARHMDTLETKYYTELIVRTVKLWLYVAKAIGNDLRKLPDEIAFKSVESSVEELITKDDPLTGYEFKPWDETRITVFDWNHKLDLTVHSSSLPQSCLDIWWAMTDAEKELDKLYPKDNPQSTDAPATPKNAPQQQSAPSAPTAPQNAGNANVGSFYTKKDAIAKLQPSDKFKMKIVQIEKHSKDGKDFYEFFEPYGGKAGQYSAASVFTDNEVALNNGLIAYLDTLGVKLGQALTGEWVVNCAVGKPKTKMFKGVEQTFTNIYVNSFEGQPVGTPVLNHDFDGSNQDYEKSN